MEEFNPYKDAAKILKQIYNKNDEEEFTLSFFIIVPQIFRNLGVPFLQILEAEKFEWNPEKVPEGKRYISIKKICSFIKYLFENRELSIEELEKKLENFIKGDDDDISNKKI